MSSHTHPIWAIARLSILMVVMFGILYINASKFDVTEIKTLVQYFLAATSLEGGLAVIKSVTSKKG